MAKPYYADYVNHIFVMIPIRVSRTRLTSSTT